MGGESKAEYIIQQLNVGNAKKIALMMVLAFMAYHGLLHLRYGTDSCKWLLSNGRFKGDKEWQPYGCMMHRYSQQDTRRCFRYLAFWGNENHFVFIGDQRLRMLYEAFISHLHPSDDDNGSLADSPVPTNLEFHDFKLKLRVNYVHTMDVARGMVEEFSAWCKDEDPPSLIVASCTHSNFLSGNTTDDLLKSFSNNMTHLVRPIEEVLAKKVRVLWKLQDPIVEDKVPKEWKSLTNDDIEALNRATQMVLKYSSVPVWASSRLIAQGLLDEATEGVQLGPLALRHDVQILLNMYCNDYMNFNDGTCCSSAEPYTILQVVTYAILGVCVALSVAMLLRRWMQNFRGQTLYMPLNQPTPADSISPIHALATLAFIMAYFYLCDRTNFFMKENKYYSEFSFWIPVGYVFALGLFFTEDSRFTKVLHRDETDELKGWMQLVILVYHMTGAERVLPIHMHIKVLISGYLFLSGYGHFTYMWQTGNAGLVRFFQILFRLNFITILLCLCMNRPYQFYYFVPLISFWYCMIYVVLALPPHITAATVDANPYQYLYLAAKFVTLLGVITILFMSEVFFERIFVTRPWKALFVTTDDDIHEWWYRWKLDRYTITSGMIFAAIFHVAQKYAVFDDNNHGNLFSRRISLTATLAAVGGVGFYTTFSFLCRNKQECEEIHSYIVFIPIIGYIVLRNISGILRTRYSSFFAWFGRISLELFICQYHIWLAADRHGVLVLIPGFPTLNVIITSFIFICVSHEVHRLTLVLLPYAVPSDWKLVVRNFVAFLIILIPIARYDGMF
ncbi:N-acetylneuraminate 9-O-acetyltransferase isoform X1 [Phlebotomus papatasi]|uniref:N-acetylneuraminate 9-O-acetyltransferase isoform X1 n=1 Tax=Phlebotomus papatasi TaxID=29031 RepID=UPI002483B495|nr:N-acetylneuraminate 9-O-acetyltransferase isoform X1 [Phlebotomus papatasi]XP_055704658.1 N-acetylneuraminate 9-O-acetyltransferase isoform X1 [Phlebotomus papatasi]